MHLGGTAQVVRFHQDDVMPGVTSATVATQQMLVDDESDLVYHIVCSRTDRAGTPRDGLRPGQTFWCSKAPENPRSSEMPLQHRVIFERHAEFSRDATRFSERIDVETPSLLPEAPAHPWPPGLDTMDRLFRVADWLAIRYQTRTLWTLRTTHLCAFLTGLMFILYTDLSTSSRFLVGFLLFLGISLGANALARRGGWHRKYLDYRTLAEGLRVQTYWAMAGVVPESRWKFAHDSYLKGQNPEFGWIRNVMRIAGMRYDACPNGSDAAMAAAVGAWIGSEDRGQLGYFRTKARDRLRQLARTRAVGRLSLGVSALTVLVFVFLGSRLPPDVLGVLTVVMGCSLLLFAVREGYGYATAVKELIKQYEFMLRIYENADRRMRDATSTHDRRQILLALGQSTLNEHSDWLLMHRERLFEDAKLWRLGG